MNNSEIKEYIDINSNQKYKEFTAMLTPGEKYQVNGVKLPVLRDLARQLAKEQGLNALKELTDDSFEEVMLQGFVIAYSKVPLEEKKTYMDRYLEKCDSWNLIDSYVTTFKLKKNEKDLMWDYLNEYKLSNEPFTVRFVLVMMLNKYLDDEHIDEVLEYTESIVSDHYYVNMAQAWLLATAYINYGDKVDEILNSDRLNKFTHNKTIQKAIESYRISDEDKERLRGMRI